MSELASEFEGNNARGDIMADVMNLVEKRIVRVLDVVAATTRVVASSARLW